MGRVGEDETAIVMDLERQLLAPWVRSSATALSDLLHPDFREVGASGRVWDRATMVEALTSSLGAADPIHHAEMEGVVVADGVVVVTYLSEVAGRRAHRISVWTRSGEHPGWQLRYHQGTPIRPR